MFHIFDLTGITLTAFSIVLLMNNSYTDKGPLDTSLESTIEMLVIIKRIIGRSGMYKLHLTFGLLISKLEHVKELSFSTFSSVESTLLWSKYSG